MSGTRTTRRQHYVPVFYLKGFCSREKGKDWLFEWDLKNGTNRRSTPVNVAWQKDLYLLTSTRSNEVERGFIAIEGHASRAILSVSEARRLNEKDLETILLFVSLQLVRVPSLRSSVDRFVSEVALKHLLIRMRTRESWAQALEEYRRAGIDAPPHGYEELRRLVESGEISIHATPEALTRTTIPGADPALALLRKRRWSLLLAKSTDFITCDNPVSVSWSGRRKDSFYPPALGGNGTDVFVPLNCKMALRGRFEGPEDVFLLGRDQVERLNAKLLKSAFRFAYSAHTSLPLPKLR